MSVTKQTHGLTLVEMMAVVFIVLLMLSISITAVLNVSKAEGLNTASRSFSNSLQLARADAISNSRRVRVVFVGSSANIVSTNDDFSKVYRAYSIVAKTDPTASDTSSGAWSYVDGWNFLPTGLVFDAGFVNALSTTSALTMGTLTVSMNYMEFRPSGRASTAGSLSLREGFVTGSGSGAATSFTSATNRANVLWDDLSGKTRVVFP